MKDRLIGCFRCGKESDKRSDFQKHHVIPQSIGGTDADGIMMLCRRCHFIIHHKIQTFMFYSIPPDLRQLIKNKVKQKTEAYVNEIRGKHKY